MKNKILVEGIHGHGAIKRNALTRFIHRNSRPKVGKASVPFDWSVGHNSISKFNIPIKDQGTSGSCGGQAGSYAMAILKALLSGEYNEISARSIYSIIFYPQGGTTTTSIENVFLRDGAMPEVQVPSYPNSEQWLEDTTWRTADYIKQALANDGYKSISVHRDINSVAEAIRDYGVVILQVDGQNGNTPDWLSVNPCPPNSNNSNPTWSHFVCAVSAQLVNGVPTITFLNSWGNSVGASGAQNFTQSYFDAGGIVDAFCFITPPPVAPQSLTNDANNVVLTPQESNFFSALIAYCGQLINRLFQK